MHKFAHLADVHLGAQKTPELKKLEFETFEYILNTCVEENVDFIIIAGDLFHSNLPDLGVVKDAVGKLKEINELGIPIYVIYGSHDFSPNATSIIDIIAESGLLKKVFLPEIYDDEAGEEKLGLQFTVDPKTKAKLVGISAKKLGLEREYYKMLDRASLESEEGFKIFVFHAGLDILPRKLPTDSLKLSYLPQRFDYYAGGDVHEELYTEDFPEYGPIVYPGSPFAGYPRDMEMSACKKKKIKTLKRGFYIVEFDEKVKNIKFCKSKKVEYECLQFNAKNKTSNQLNDEIMDKIEETDFNEKIVIVKVQGTLTGGKTSDINFNEVRMKIRDRGAIHVGISHFSFRSKEFEAVTYKGEEDSEIERNLFKENISNVDVIDDDLNDENGVELAVNLMNILKESQKVNEKKSNYSSRILKDSLNILDI